MKKILSKLRKKFGLYDLRKEGAKWVAKNLGEEYVQEFLDKYDTLCRGGVIGGFYETAILEKIKEEIRSTYYSQGDGYDDFPHGYMYAKGEDMRVIDKYIQRGKGRK